MHTRVMVMARHQLVREGLGALLSRQGDFALIGSFGDGREGAAQAVERRPELVMMELQLEGLHGVDVIRRIASGSPHTRVLCLAADEPHDMMRIALEAGARGFLAKDASPEEMLRALAAVRHRQLYLSPSLAEAAVIATTPDTHRSYAFCKLTPKEREVVQLLAEGLSTKEAAARLNLSVKTVATHREHATGKLGIRGVAALTRFAIREGLAHP